MNDWERVEFDISSLLHDITPETIENHAKINLPYYPWHIYDVERNIRDASVVSSKVYEHDSSHGVKL